MTARKKPTEALHFTHVDHLATVIDQSLLSDAMAQNAGVLAVEVGDREIKERRRHREVPVPPGGAVADYVPFYFAPRSPMMYSISRDNVVSYRHGTARLIYLVTSLERLHTTGHEVVLSDRNAAIAYADFRIFDPSDRIDDEFIDWELMTQRFWADTEDDRQRKERRMAEALVHRRVAWEAIEQIVTQNGAVAAEVCANLAAAQSSIPVSVRPEWYF